MNRNQRRIVITMIVVIIGMFAFPPFEFRTATAIRTNMGYSWIANPPPRNSSFTSTVDIPMLLAQWFGVLLIGGLAFFVAKDNGDQ
jgi:hypothetical protein